MTKSDPFLMKLGLKLLLGIVAVSVFAPLFKRRAKRSKWLLRGWAAKNGFKILQADKCTTISSNYQVFRVRVRDGSGKKRCGSVRCGSFLGGLLFGSRVKVKWEGE